MKHVLFRDDRENIRDCGGLCCRIGDEDKPWFLVEKSQKKTRCKNFLLQTYGPDGRLKQSRGDEGQHRVGGVLGRARADL